MAPAASGARAQVGSALQAVTKLARVRSKPVACTSDSCWGVADGLTDPSRTMARTRSGNSVA